jgi:hypothetical protein
MALARRVRAWVALATVAALFTTSLPVPVQARLMSTEAILATQAGAADRERVREFLARDDVRSQMESLGVSADEASRRVDALSDEEVRRIAGKLDDMPVGGNALGVVIGAAVLIFIVLLITDIAGLTKVFPWTRSIR